MICPNKNHPDWKALVAKHGEAKAMRMFVENDYQIPANAMTERGSMFDSIKGLVFKKASTMDSINNNPSLANKIIDSLKELYPEVKISKDGIFDKNGEFVKIRPGEHGMHYRNAFTSVVAWANDAFLETPPHEYAHHYVDMFRNHPMIAQAIENYGEERLVEKIGKYYAGEFTNPGFKNFIERFWNMVRSLFGHPNVAYQIFENFKNGEELNVPRTAGTSIVRYQATATPLSRNSISDVSTTSKVAKTSNAVGKINHKNKFREYFLKPTDEWKSPEAISKDPKARASQFIEYLGSRISKLKGTDSKHDVYRNVAQLDKKIIENIEKLLRDSKYNLFLVTSLASLYASHVAINFAASPFAALTLFRE